MTAVTFADLGKTEQDVMVQLAQQRVCNLPALAADLWRLTPDWAAFDPYPLLIYVIDSLTSRGLVSFRLKAYSGERLQKPHDIRLSPTGWALMGFANRTVEVGQPGTHSGDIGKRTDGTNYRNHGDKAQGGHIETDTFAHHRMLFPSHIHMYGDNPLTSTETDMRTYTRVTPEMEASVIYARDRLGITSYADIAAHTDLTERQVKYILVDLPRLRRMHTGDEKAEGSLKNRIMRAVTELGQIKDVAEMRRILGMADDEHSVMHVLHSLHTQGRLDFTERGNGMGTATVINIRLPKKGKPQPMPVVSRQEEERELSEAKRIAEEELGHPAIDATGVEVTVVEPEGYPLLDELLDRERNRLERDTKVMAYLAAAEALEKVDPDAAVELMRKANTFDVTFPSPLEQEYVRYVAAHPPVGPDVQAQAEGD